MFLKKYKANYKKKNGSYYYEKNGRLDQDSNLERRNIDITEEDISYTALEDSDKVGSTMGIVKYHSFKFTANVNL